MITHLLSNPNAGLAVAVFYVCLFVAAAWGVGWGLTFYGWLRERSLSKDIQYAVRRRGSTEQTTPRSRVSDQR